MQLKRQLCKDWRSRLADLQTVKNRVHEAGLSIAEKLLLCLAIGDQPKSVAQIRGLAVDVGLREASNWNVSKYLGDHRRYVIRTKQGWEITSSGNKAVLELLGHPSKTTLASAAVDSLGVHIARISDPDTQDFLREAISCISNKEYRAAVVLSWVGAVSVLHKEVAKKHLKSFNAEATRRDPNRWKPAKTSDDLGRMQESEFLNILSQLSIIGKNVKQELESCLTLRNGCGHPNTLKVGEAKVAAHVETLIQNVFEKF
jgi:hypothetical protein